MDFNLVVRLMSWLRRVVIVPATAEAHYRIVASAMSEGGYDRLNLKVRLCSPADMFIHHEIAWPFDIVIIGLGFPTHPWMTETAGFWRSLLTRQATKGFLLIVFGSEEEALMLEDTMLRTEREYVMLSNEPLLKLGVRTYDLSAAAICDKTKKDRADADVTHQLLWGGTHVGETNN